MTGPITAYHGSPHDFEQFDTSKIGTGEGAQAYGHGLYFAEHEPVAKGYRDQLAKPEPNNPHANAWDLINRYHDNEQDLINMFESMPNRNEMAEGTLQSLKSGLYKNYQPKGHMYEVAIDAHPDHFLDWDKPVDLQPSHIQDAVFDTLMKAHEKAGNKKFMIGSFRGPIRDEENKKHSRWDTLSGGAVHNMLSKVLEPEELSHSLSANGIHGIKYLDEQSREKRFGTHNYVVFDHNRVKVRRKYEEGGFVRRAYKKGGKVEGAIWHERDAFDDGGDVRGGDSVGGLRGDTGGFSGMSDKSESETKNDTGGGEDSGFGKGFSDVASAIGNAIISPAEAKENPPQLARSFINPHETVNAALASGRADVAPSGLMHGVGTEKDVSEANAAEAAAAKMDLAFGKPVGTTTFNTPPLGGGEFEPPRSATGTPAESLLASVQPSTPTIEQIKAPADAFVKAANAGIAGMQDQPQHYEPMGNKIEYQNPFKTPTEFQTPTGTYTGSYDQTGAAGTPAQSIAAVQPTAPTTQPTAQSTQPMAPAGNVPMPPTPIRDLQGPDIAEKVAGVFGLSTQQQFDKFYKGYIDQGHSETDAYNKAIGDIQTMRANAYSKPMGSKRQMIQQVMPDGTIQMVPAPYNKGGVAKSPRSLHNTAIVEQALHKVSAPLPALDPSLMAAKAGRRY